MSLKNTAMRISQNLRVHLPFNALPVFHSSRHFPYAMGCLDIPSHLDDICNLQGRKVFKFPENKKAAFTVILSGLIVGVPCLIDWFLQAILPN